MSKFSLRKAKLSFTTSTIGRSLNMLDKSDRIKVVLVTITQIFLSILDLIGVALLGVVGALVVSGGAAQKPGGRITALLTAVNIESKPLQFQAAVVGITAAVFLIMRSILSVYLTRKSMFFLSRKSASISSRLVTKLLSLSLKEVQRRTSQSTIYALTQGVNAITLGVLGTTISLISDSALLVVMAIGLFVVDPIIAVSTFVIFILLALALYQLLHVRIRHLGVLNSELSIDSAEKIMEVLTSYRESIVRNRRQYYAQEIGRLRLVHANTLAEISFTPSISKYVIETAVIIGALIIGATQFAFNDSVHAVATLSVFLAAVTRIAPAVLRMQQGVLQIKGSLGSATPTLDLIESLSNVESMKNSDHALSLKHDGFQSEIEINSITIKYPNAITPAVEDVSLNISSGESVALVGSSGAGKTTLADSILGVLTPSNGFVKISGVSPLEAISKWPGAISYVPQDVAIVNGSIKYNVALGFPEEQISDELIWDALRKAHLLDFVTTLPKKLESQVGERGTSLSGGQRQRLGIARALLTNPKLLVLDEATSALDGETEANITDSISGLKGKVTVIVIAHRLSTIRNVDKVVYLEKGKLIKTGTFEEVKNSVPKFGNQANIMGL
jgi:ABC-type multidrug transport system fused ATPase/permease subunit